MKSIRTEPHNDGAEGDERIRTAVCEPSDEGVYVPRGVIGCAGEIRHGVEMLRHWRGNAEAQGAWLNHVDRYSRRLSELLARGGAR